MAFLVLNSNMLLNLFYQAKFLSDAWLKFERKSVSIIYYRLHTLPTKVTVYDFLVYFACGTSLLIVSNNHPAYTCRDSTCLGTGFPWWKFPGEIAVRAYRSLLQDFLGRSLCENLRNAALKTYYTPQLCRIVQLQPPYYGSFLTYDLPKNW